MSKKSKKAGIAWLLASVGMLLDGERRLTPIGVFKSERKAQEWAQDRLREAEQSAEGDGVFGIEFGWQAVKGQLPGERKCMVWDPPRYDATGKAQYQAPMGTEYVLAPVPTKPEAGARYREFWAERVAVLEQKGASRREVAEAEKILDYVRENDL